MSTLRNRVQLIGRVGQAPEIKTFEGGTKRAQFSIAVNEMYYNEKNERVENTYWHFVVGWGKVADIIEKFVDKGKEVAIDGKLTSRNYEDKEGNKRYVTEVIINEILLFSDKDLVRNK